MTTLVLMRATTMASKVNTMRIRAMLGLQIPLKKTATIPVMVTPV